MPNLRSHILLAEEIYNNIQDPELKSLIRSHFPYYYLGSIAPDIFYYNLFLPVKLPQLGDLLHDFPSPHTRSIIKQMLDRLKGSPRPDKGSAAFCLGFITHIVVENIFHPMVYYFTGNYNDQDPHSRRQNIASHRQLETYLDLFMLRHFHRKVEDIDLGKVIFISPFKRKKVFSFYASALAGISGESAGKIWAGLNFAYPSLLFLNSLFSRKGAYYFLKLLNLLNHERISPYLQMFYPPGDSPLPILFTAPFTYLHPVTGTEVKTSMQKLNDEAVAAGADILTDACRYFHDKGDDSFLGKIKIMDGEMRYFSSIQF